jgi:hypothetical protein
VFICDPFTPFRQLISRKEKVVAELIGCVYIIGLNFEVSHSRCHERKENLEREKYETNLATVSATLPQQSKFKRNTFCRHDDILFCVTYPSAETNH